MDNIESVIQPDDIRAIREGLGLSQIDAGELLGGGPRAFTKYEAGTIRPTASVVRLLRVLEGNRDALALLTGSDRPLASAGYILPLEVTGEHITLLTDRTFPVLLRRLLSAEAQAHGLPEYGIHVAGSITTPDGGEDGRITWTKGPLNTSFLPSRFNQFQVKAGQVAPAAAALDVVSRSGEVKPMVRSALKARGHYIMLCAHSYTHQQIEARENRIRVVLRDAGIELDDSQVDFRDADQVADWVNRYPSVAAWVKQWTQPGAIGPFCSLTQWSSRSEHDSSPWADDDRLPGLRESVRERASKPRHVIRMVGPSGIGKSRLILEALASSEQDERLGFSLADLVLYADESEVGNLAINGAVQTLAENRQRAVVVVDRCSPETHRTLVGMVRRQEGLLSLITIDDDIPSAARDRTIVEVTNYEILVKVPEAPSPVTEAIISSVCPGLPSEDFRRLAYFSRGFPKIAHLVAQAWTNSRPVAHATEEHLVETFVVGRRSYDRELLLGSAQLLAAFRLVRVDYPDGDQLAEVVTRDRNLSAADLRDGINQLIDRGVAQRRGRYVTLEPRPIALYLAERKWRDWSPDEWEAILGGDTSSDLKVCAAKQLALLNTTTVAQQVVKHVCRFGGVFDGIKGLVQRSHTEVLSVLAEIDTSLVAVQIERSLQHFSDLDMVRGDIRRHLVWALEKIAFHSDSFDEGAHMLLRLALVENEAYSNNATGLFVGLFPVILGNTAADGYTRLLFLREVAQSDDPVQRKIVVDALVNGSETHHFSRSVGSETHGSRPTLPSWHPATRDEALSYIQCCVDLLVEFASGNDDVADYACIGLGRNLGSLASDGFIDLVEEVVRQVAPTRDSWPEALEALSEFLRRKASSVELEIVSRVSVLIDELSPQSLDARMRLLVTEMPWDYLCDEKLVHEQFEQLYLRQVVAVREFAAELMQEPDTLRDLLPRLSRRLEPREGRHPQRMICPFGKAIADFAESPLDWLGPITEALSEVPEAERDFDLLSGYLVGINETYPEKVELFKERAAAADVLAPALPLVCWRLGIVATDIELVLSALRAGLLSPWQLIQWGGGGVLAEVEAHAVAPLFDALLDHSAESDAVALDLLGMYVFQRLDTLENFRSQLQKIAENFTKYPSLDHHTVVAHHFGNLMKWILEKGRDDPDARAVALALSRALVDLGDDTAEEILRVRMIEKRMIEPVIQLLLGSFPEITWPIVGSAIISDPLRAWNLGRLLGSRMSSDDRHDSVILSLPEDVLFEWCRAHPNSAPAFTATVVPVLTTYNREAVGHSLHPYMARLLDEFGDRKDVLRSVEANIHSYFGWGSPTGYFALHEAPLSKLRDEHPSAKVRHWAKATLRDIAVVSEGIRSEEDEWKARNDV